MNEQEIAFFKEAKRIQELWEPKFGDWAMMGRHSKDIVLIVGVLEYTLDMVPMSWEGWEEGMIHNGLQEHLMFLPRQGQLQEMLEERGYWWLMGVGASTQDYIVEIRDWEGVMPLIAKASGPTPSIALGRALIEVMKDAQPR